MIVYVCKIILNLELEFKKTNLPNQDSCIRIEKIKKRKNHITTIFKKKTGVLYHPDPLI